jgi:hypothetical protein
MKPAMLTASAAIVMAAIALYNSFPSRPLTCDQYRLFNRADTACNKATADGFYWQVETKLEHYSDKGIQGDDNVPQCNELTIGNKAMTGRFPIQDVFFRDVRKVYRNIGTNSVDADCASIGRAAVTSPGGREPRHHPENMCGIYEVVCQSQPQSRALTVQK